MYTQVVIYRSVTIKKLSAAEEQNNVNNSAEKMYIFGNIWYNAFKVTGETSDVTNMRH